MDMPVVSCEPVDAFIVESTLPVDGTPPAVDDTALVVAVCVVRKVVDTGVVVNACVVGISA